MGDIPLEPYLNSSYSYIMENIEMHSEISTPMKGVENSIRIDSYCEIPKGLENNSVSVETVGYDVGELNPEYIKDTTEYGQCVPLYKRLSSMIFAFNKCMVAPEDSIHDNPVGESLSSTDSNGKSGVPTLRKRLYNTMEQMMKKSPLYGGSIIAMFRSFPLNIVLSGRFVPDDDNFADCFALFIEDKNTSINEIKKADIIHSNIRCEIRNKKSHELISESGPYEFVYEENLEQDEHNEAFKNVFGEHAFQNAKIRFFQKIRSYKSGLSWTSSVTGSMDDTTSTIRTNLNMLVEYLSNRAQSSSKTPFRFFARKNIQTEDSTNKPVEESTISLDSETARARLEEHIRLHTDHWGEVQYDDIEVVLRDVNNDSIIKLPYTCQIM